MDTILFFLGKTIITLVKNKFLYVGLVIILKVLGN